MKTIILSLILISILQSGSTQNLSKTTSTVQWAKPLQANKESKQDLSASNFIIDENNVLIREYKTNAFPTDINSPFYRINKRVEKSKEFKLRPRINNEIRKFDFYSINRAD